MLTILTATACARSGEHTGFIQSVSGATAVGLAATASNPALCADAPNAWLELAVVPGPFGLPELSVGSMYYTQSDTAGGRLLGAQAMVGRAWHAIDGIGLWAWRIAPNAHVGLQVATGTSGGHALDRAWYARANAGARWHVDSVWSMGVAVTNVVTAGLQPRPTNRLTLGVGRRLAQDVAGSVDATVDPTAGLGITLAVRLAVQSALVTRIAIQSNPMVVTLGIRCSVTPVTHVLLDVEFVNDLGTRTRVAAAWLW